VLTLDDALASGCYFTALSTQALGSAHLACRTFTRNMCKN